MNTVLVFPMWESIKNISIGDPGVFDAKKIGKNLVLLEPQSFIGSDTNLIVIGKNGLIYNFYIRSEGYNSDNVPDLVVYIKSSENRGFYPKKSALHNKEEPKSKINISYTMSGSKKIAPNFVYSDGDKLWLYYKKMPKICPLVVSLENGYEVPLDSYVEGNYLVLYSNEIVLLKNGKQVTCIKPSK